MGWTTAALQHTVFANDEPVTQVVTDRDARPAPTVTVTKTVTSLPKSCSDALHAFDRYLDAAAIIGGANNQQLDIISKANQAILLRDWKMLGEASEDQRNLERTLGPASSKVLPVLIQVKEGMKKCRSDVH